MQAWQPVDHAARSAAAATPRTGPVQADVDLDQQRRPHAGIDRGGRRSACVTARRRQRNHPPQGRQSGELGYLRRTDDLVGDRARRRSPPRAAPRLPHGRRRNSDRACLELHLRREPGSCGSSHAGAVPPAALHPPLHLSDVAAHLRQVEDQRRRRHGGHRLADQFAGAREVSAHAGPPRETPVSGTSGDGAASTWQAE